MRLRLREPGELGELGELGRLEDPREEIQLLPAQRNQPALGLVKTKPRDAGVQGDLVLREVQARPCDPEELRERMRGEW